MLGAPMRRARPALLLASLLSAACSGAQDGTSISPATPCPTVPPTASAAPSAAPTPPPASVAAAIASAEGRVVTVASRDTIPLTGPRVDGRPGDIMVENGKAAAVVTREGRIVDYGLAGGRDEIVWLNPTLAVGLSNLDAPVIRLSAEAGDKAIRLERAVAGKPLVLITWVYLKGTALHLETVAESTGDDPALAVTLGERVSWGNVPTWMDGHGLVKAAGKLTGGFLGRDALGVAYAVCSSNGPLYAKFDDQEFGGLFEAARTGESVVLVPARGRSPARSIAVAASERSLADAVMALPCGPKGPRTTLAVGSVPVPRARLALQRCAEGDRPGKPFLELRGTPDTTGPATTTTASTTATTASATVAVASAAARGTSFGSIQLPQGCFRARLVAPGHAPGPWTEPEKLAGKVAPELLPQAGTLAFSVTEAGKSLPARLVVRGEGTTSDPDWGDDADGTGAAANVLSADKGSGEIALPAGKYRVSINRGFEYTAHEEKIEIKVGKITAIRAALDRVVDTKGWVAADLHLHAVPSSDAPSLLSDRIRSLVAAGIEVAVATDHNAITDYRPTIAELGHEGRIYGLTGDEITTRDVPFGHFNAFPLAPTTAPFTFKGTTPAAIFAEVRAAKPFGKDTIMQVNHPRMGGIGYFELLRFDPQDIPGWLARSPLADLGFDALEVFNGDHYAKLCGIL